MRLRFLIAACILSAVLGSMEAKADEGMWMIHAIDAALEKEAANLFQKLPKGAKLIAMCVEGKTRSSEELAKMMADGASRGESHLVFLIGGSFGLHPSIKAQAAYRLSMSPMTFPHQLARVMLLEQTYRACKILSGEKYHK